MGKRNAVGAGYVSLVNAIATLGAQTIEDLKAKLHDMTVQRDSAVRVSENIQQSVQRTQEEVRRLQQWKAEAVEVIEGWERCRQWLGESDEVLGEMNSDNVFNFLEELTSENSALREHTAQQDQEIEKLKESRKAVESERNTLRSLVDGIEHLVDHAPTTSSGRSEAFGHIERLIHPADLEPEGDDD